MNMNDTIAAIATAPGQGGIGIIRLSGPEAEEILGKVFFPAGKTEDGFESHRMMYGHLRDGEETVDECMAVLMRAPRSYTREDVAEIHTHGGSGVTQRAMELCLDRGARLAEPGEFTRRAFLNGRVDLSRAEAVMSLIAARGEQERKAAVEELNGGVTAFVRKAADELYRLQAGIAALIDYPEEITEEEATADLTRGLRGLIASLEGAVDERKSRLLRDGLRVVLAGRPNVGKSSLLNAFLGEDRAIVTAIPGTTRDLVRGEMTLDGIRIRLTDTAGLRESEDPVERIGVSRSEQALREADLVLMVLDGSEALTEEERERIRKLPEHSAVILNKSDLGQRVTEGDIIGLRPGIRVLTCSAPSPETLDGVKEYLREFTRISDRMTLTQPRQIDALRRAVGHLKAALETAERMTPDMVSTDLQAAQAALGEITGDNADEKLLDTVFSRFCVGK